MVGGALKPAAKISRRAQSCDSVDLQLSASKCDRPREIRLGRGIPIFLVETEQLEDDGSIDPINSVCEKSGQIR